MKKKVCSILLIVVILLGTIYPIISYAENSYVTDVQHWEGFSYIINNDDTITIRDGYGFENEILIPAQIEGKTVTRIDMKSRKRILTIPETVTYINVSESDCLEHVNLPNNIKNLNNKAFYNCTNLRSINIPDSLEVIGKNCFANCRSLEEVRLSKNLKSIEEEAFLWCEKLKSIDIPDTVTKIGDGAFAGAGLTRVTISRNIIELPARIFNGCYYLKDIHLPEGLVSIKDEAFRNSGIETIKLPKGLKAIGISAFEDCEFLTNIDLPEGLTSIKYLAFNYCSKLKDITIPESVTTIEEWAFANCTSLKDIKLPEGLISMGDGVFAHSTSLTTIRIPKNIKKLPDYTFYECNTLKNVELQEGLESIGRCAFWKTSIDTIFFPRSVKEINSSFQGLYEELEEKPLTIQGYSATYAEEYAKYIKKYNYYTNFIPVDGITINKEVKNKDYILIITDSTKNRITSTTVEIDGNGQTIQNGIVTFDRTAYSDNQVIPVKLNINNNEYIIYHEIQPSGKGYIKLPVNPYQLVTATANGHEVLTAVKVLNLEATEEIELKLQTTNTQDIVQYKIYQGNKMLATVERKSRCRYYITNKRFINRG